MLNTLRGRTRGRAAGFPENTTREDLFHRAEDQRRMGIPQLTWRLDRVVDAQTSLRNCLNEKNANSINRKLMVWNLSVGPNAPPEKYAHTCSNFLKSVVQ